jgi:hypothetical protein
MFDNQFAETNQDLFQHYQIYGLAPTARCGSNRHSSMISVEDMEYFIEQLTHEIDNAANMNW